MATNLCVGTSNQALKPIKKQQLKRHDLNLKVIAKKSFNFITLSIHVRETDKYPQACCYRSYAIKAFAKVNIFITKLKNELFRGSISNHQVISDENINQEYNLLDEHSKQE